MTQKTFLAVLRHSIVLALICCFGFNTAFAQCTADLFAGGTGTQLAPYQIDTPERLQNLNECLGDGYKDNYYVLTKDIDLTDYLSGEGNNEGAGWKPIGYYSYNRFVSAFWGNLDGNRHRVSGLWINRPAENFVGLFAHTVNEFGGAKISNIGVEIDGKGIKGGSIYVGGLVGENMESISNSYATGSVTGTNYVGGLVGDNYNIISNSYYDKQTTGQSDTDKGVGKNTAPNLSPPYRP